MRVHGQGSAEAEASLCQAVEDLISIIDTTSNMTAGHSGNGELPSWCCAKFPNTDSNAPHSLHLQMQLGETMTNYYEALRGTFSVKEPRGLRAPPRVLTAPFPAHLQDTTVEIGRILARIRAVLSCSRGTADDVGGLLQMLHQETSRLIAQAEAADESLSSSSTAGKPMRTAAKSALEAAEHFVSRHSGIRGSLSVSEKAFAPKRCHKPDQVVAKPLPPKSAMVKP